MALNGSPLLTCARLYLRERGMDLVAGMWMLSWGPRGPGVVIGVCGNAADSRRPRRQEKGWRTALAHPSGTPRQPHPDGSCWASGSLGRVAILATLTVGTGPAPLDRADRLSSPGETARSLDHRLALLLTGYARDPRLLGGASERFESGWVS